ncbi:MAG TPA: GAF domain-containing sensor histidine kinase [Aggregatilineales bacterium]|nr:GAF domain-containing sensor histidine kinase [Aggregatilineales bacterium]
MARTRPESDADKLRRRNRELSILNTIAQAMNQEVDLTRSLNTALAQVAALFDLQTSWIYLLDEEGKAYLAAAQNLPPALAEHPRRMGGSCDCLWYYERGQLPSPTNITCSRLENLAVGTLGLRQHASIPLNAHGRPLGVLNVTSADWDDISTEDLRLLYLVGDLVSIAIERGRLFTRSVEIGAVEERNRLAREIHDTLAQGLAGIALQLETADALLESGQATERVRGVVEQALRLTREHLEEARRSVLDLRAAPLEGRRLDEAAAQLVQEWAARRKIEAQVEVIGSQRPLPARVEVGLYRILQEALTNIGRHAQAKHTRVQLMLLPEGARLLIDDDGRGFDPAQVPPNHYGLIGMNERARLLGGHLEVSSTPGQGTQIDVYVPLEISP